MRLPSKRKGIVTVYYWETEKYGKKYKLNGRTLRSRCSGLLRHIKRETGTPISHLHIAPYEKGYAIFNKDGERMVYRGKSAKFPWKGEPVVRMETMHEVYDYNV